MVAVSAPCVVRGDALTWTGAQSSSWSNPQNWSPTQLPTASVDAKINNGGVAQLSGATGTARDLEVARVVSETGNLQISAGGMLTTRDGFIGDVVSVAGVGSQWTARNLAVGFDGSITVSDGALASSMSATLGDQPDSQGVVTVTGANSRWTNAGLLSIGSGGSGSVGGLLLSDGGTAVTTGGTHIGASEQGVGSVTVEAGSTWTDGGVSVGYVADGFFDLNGGSAATGSATIGHGVDAVGEVNLNGASAMWTQSGTLHVGYDGTGHLRARAGAKVITNGASGGIVGFGSESKGYVFLDAGSMWTLAGDLQVGRLGYGEIQVLAGSTLSNKFGVVGADGGVDEGVDGYVYVNGGTWTNMNTLVVGQGGYGALLIEGGGDVTASGTNPNLASSIGNASGNGNGGGVRVQGAGSTWTNNVIGLFVGNLGSGNLEIADGGLVSNGNGVVGRNSGSQGTVRIEGSGSTWTNNGSLDVGDVGEGYIDVLDGGTLSNTHGRIGTSVNGYGSVLVEGATWNNSATLRVGASGEGKLRIGAGGTVTAPGGTTVGAMGTLSGVGTLVSTVTNNGVVAPGLSPGTLHVQGGFTQSSTGSLMIELASPTSFDVLDVTGSVALGGALDVILTDGYTPAPGASFEFLRGASFSGAFSSVTVRTPTGPAGSFTLTSTPTGLSLANYQGGGGPPTAGLIAYWNAENGAVDVTGNGHDGVFLGDASTAVTGPFGKAFTFDGAGDYISIGDELDMGTADFTLSAWINGDPTMQQWARIFDKGYFTAYSLHRRGFDNHVGFEGLNSGNFFGTTTPVIDGDWHHVALVKAGTTVTIYADGEAEGSNAISGAAQDNSLPLLIGFNPGEGIQGFWKGLLDELKIFNRALSPAEVAALALAAGATPGDFNRDGAVNAADLAQWSGDFGADAGSDADADGDSDGADFLEWQRRFGTLATAASVPEPGACILSAVAALALVRRTKSNFTVA